MRTAAATGITAAFAAFGEAMAQVTLAFARFAVARYASDAARYGERTAAALRLPDKLRVGVREADYVAAAERLAARWRSADRHLLDLLPVSLHHRVTARVVPA